MAELINVLEVAHSNDVFPKRRYYESLNPGVTRFFESDDKTTALTCAKNWARSHGYTHLLVVSMKMGTSNKLYDLSNSKLKKSK